MVANKAQSIYANYLETSEKAKLAMFLEIAERAEAQAKANPKLANAHYWMAYALGRYSQGISVAKALTQGLGSKVKTALETTIALAPKHSDAHIALGAFHAEVIDKVGKLLGKTQGADTATGLKMFKEALALNPDSAIARVEYANGLVMLEGDKRMKEAEQPLRRGRGMQAAGRDGAAGRGDGQGRARGRVSVRSDRADPHVRTSGLPHGRIWRLAACSRMLGAQLQRGFSCVRPSSRS